MKIHHTQTTYWLIAIFLVLSLLGIAKGCKKDRNPAGPARTQRGLALKLSGDSEVRAKATGITVTAEGLDVHGNLTGDTVEERVSAPIFPLDVPIILYEPPCRWRITVTVDLMREPPRVASGEIDVCQEAGAELTMETFEAFRVESWAIDAPAEVIAGQAAEVSCEAAINAPDRDRAPPVMTLYEEDGHAVEGPITTTLMLSGSFPDPYPSTSLQEYRIFTCTIADGCSPDQSFERLVRRILPTPTPEPTGTPTPAPGTSTPTPTPGPCTVLNENDSSAGSLRQVLADAPTNSCITITFAPAVTTITVTSELTPPVMTVTIDGGSGVTISGGNTTRVFWVNGGTNVTFQNLTIRDGQTGGNGGGIYNNGGTVTIASGCTVSGNTATLSYGGGIYNNSGTVTVNGTVSDNTANRGGGIWNDGGTLTVNGTVSDNIAPRGGGIWNDGGTVTVNGTVSGNTAAMDDGGGIYNYNSGTVTVNGTVRDNTAPRGGGIFITLSSGTVTIAASGTVRDNTATSQGGGIFDDGGGPLTVNGTVNGNTATSRGGGIYIGGGTVNIAAIGRIISNNANPVPGSGGGVYNAGGTLNGANGTTVNSNTPDQCAPVACP